MSQPPPNQIHPKNYYVNPTFSQQSEYYPKVRQSPLGAQAQQYHDECDEQEFYEEMLVDDAGCIKEKKVVVVSSPSRYARPAARYEYIPMQEQPRYVLVPSSTSPQKAGGAFARAQPRYEYIGGERSPSRYECTSARAPATPKRAPLVSRQLNYAVGAQQGARSMAVVAPVRGRPRRREEPPEEGEWALEGPRKPTQITLAAAAVMMMLCGAVTSALCFYMVSIMGRLYFLDFGIVAGFTCLALGILGFRTRNCYWLPNRNYISGYILLSVLSLLMCAGLLVLMVLRPKPGTPIADMTSGAICGISALSLILASVGVMTSYCCKYPPPDNRVQHTAPGFIV